MAHVYSVAPGCPLHNQFPGLFVYVEVECWESNARLKLFTTMAIGSRSNVPCSADMAQRQDLGLRQAIGHSS
jgi:hypothetical protein